MYLLVFTDSDNMSTTSSPEKTSEMKADDSGVSIQLSDLTHNSMESTESDHLNPEQKMEEVISIESGKQCNPIYMRANISSDNLYE